MVSESLRRGTDIARVELDTETLDQPVHEVEERSHGHGVVERGVIPSRGKDRIRIRLGHGVRRERQLASESKNRAQLDLDPVEIAAATIRGNNPASTPMRSAVAVWTP